MDEPDLESQAAYYKYLSRTGLAGLIILGTNAEAFLLTREERKTLIATARQAIGPDFPIMACCGAHTKKVLELISDAKDAWANSVLVLPPGYFGKATTPEVIERFSADVSKGSKLPIVIYNFPEFATAWIFLRPKLPSCPISTRTLSERSLPTGLWPRSPRKPWSCTKRPP